jgi:hypothetical protein
MSAGHLKVLISTAMAAALAGSSMALVKSIIR